jgi:hypothetical protein
MSMVAKWSFIIAALMGIFENKFIALYEELAVVPKLPKFNCLGSGIALGGSFTYVRFIGA